MFEDRQHRRRLENPYSNSILFLLPVDKASDVHEHGDNY